MYRCSTYIDLFPFSTGRVNINKSFSRDSSALGRWGKSAFLVVARYYVLLYVVATRSRIIIIKKKKLFLN